MLLHFPFILFSFKVEIAPLFKNMENVVTQFAYLISEKIITYKSSVHF